MQHGGHALSCGIVLQLRFAFGPICGVSCAARLKFVDQRDKGQGSDWGACGVGRCFPRGAGQGDLPIDGLRAWLCQQLPVWVLWGSRLVRCAGLSSGTFSFLFGEISWSHHGVCKAMADLRCSGAEWSVEECSWSAPDDACMGHAYDTVVYCTASDRAGAPQGAVRLIAADGSPSIDGRGRPEILMESAWVPICSSGISSGAAAVICKSMGFSGSAGSTKCTGRPTSIQPSHLPTCPSPVSDIHLQLWSRLQAASPPICGVSQRCVPASCQRQWLWHCRAWRQ